MNQHAATINSRVPWEHSSLEFVTDSADGYLDALGRLYQGGARAFLLAPQTGVANEVGQAMQARFPDVRLFRPDNGAPGPAPSGNGEPDSVPVDAAVLFLPGARDLSKALLEYMESPARIVAPVTDQYIGHRSVFMISIPKSGTHLLFELLGQFRLSSLGGYAGELKPQHFYFPQASCHVTPMEFVNSLRTVEHGGADHPLWSTPTVLMYRNPMDIVVSECAYYARPDRTPLARFLSSLTDDERLLSLIGPSLLTASIRERLIQYSPWLQLPNIIPISFEELVGPRGDGSLEAQLSTIWSLQLRLHIPGRPAAYGEAIYREESATFNKGQINGHARAFRQEHAAAFRALPQDFMKSFGYDADDEYGPGYLPRFVREFRRRVPQDVGTAGGSRSGEPEAIASVTELEPKETVSMRR